MFPSGVALDIQGSSVAASGTTRCWSAPELSGFDGIIWMIERGCQAAGEWVGSKHFKGASRQTWPPGAPPCSPMNPLAHHLTRAGPWMRPIGPGGRQGGPQALALMGFWLDTGRPFALCVPVTPGVPPGPRLPSESRAYVQGRARGADSCQHKREEVSPHPRRNVTLSHADYLHVTRLKEEYEHVH